MAGLTFILDLAIGPAGGSSWLPSSISKVVHSTAFFSPAVVAAFAAAGAAIEEIYDVDLEGHAVAAVEDCSQKFYMYFNFDLLHKIEKAQWSWQWSWLPNEGFDPADACVFNRGVLVIDVKKWLQENLTETIERWLDEFSSADFPLYKYGVSQPPFLLALYKKYLKLDILWNVRGLGRKEFSEAEREYISKLYGKRPGKDLSSPQKQTKLRFFILMGGTNLGKGEGHYKRVNNLLHCAVQKQKIVLIFDGIISRH